MIGARGWSRSFGTAWLAAGSTMVLSGALLAQPAAQGMAHQRLGPGIHVLSGHANGNILVVERGGTLLLVDAQAPDRVAQADSLLRTITSAPVRTVVFTHYHEDHTGGMPHWRTGGATAVGHAALVAELRKDTTITEMGWTRTAAPEAAFPDRTVADSATLVLGDLAVHLLHPPAAHTNGDLVVWIPALDLLHTGDLVEPGASPFIDWWAGGTLDGMLAAADLLLARAGPATRIVPGHGPVIGRAELERHRAMLVALGERVRAAQAAGTSRADFLAGRPAAEFEDVLGGAAPAERFLRLLWYGLGRGG